ncbi:MAG: 50S ribosomal protein L23 [Patescibacteria group bacterium]
MSIFKPSKKEDKKEKPKVTAVDLNKNLPAKRNATEHKIIFGILKKPHVTEKAGMFKAQNKYVFLVEEAANKPMIKEEISRHYGVRVEDVNIIHGKSKRRHIGQVQGHEQSFKKAIVTIAKGEKLEIT